MINIEHESTMNIICPHCGYEDINSWEMCGDDGEEYEYDCDSCGKEYIAWKNVYVDFSTAIPKSLKNVYKEALDVAEEKAPTSLNVKPPTDDDIESMSFDG